MDCKTARLLLFFDRPGTADADSDESQALARHLGQCSECETLAQTERLVENRIAQAIRDVPIPAGLRGRLIERMAAERRLRRRRILIDHPRIAAGIAAALLIGSFAGVYLATRPLPSVDIAARHGEALEQRNNLPETIETWYRQKHGVATVAPPNFKYAFLDSYDLVVDTSGRRVPQLVFVNGSERARVLIFTDRDFDLRAALSEPPADSGGLRAEIYLHPFKPDVVYLVIHNSSELKNWLVTEPQPPA
jgi:hypothetical protein